MADRKPMGIARGRGKVTTVLDEGGRSEDREAKRPAWNLPGEGVPRPCAPATIQSVGRATTHRIPEQIAGTSAGPSAAPHAASGDAQRGAMRGRRPLTNYDIIRTRSDTLPTKKGTTGRPVKLSANYFRLLKKPTWSLYQYHVDYSPDVESIGARKGLLFVHAELLGGHIFDGSALFLTNRLSEDVIELFSKNRLDENIRITVKFIGLVSMAEGRAVQILNMILRKALNCLKLQLVARNFFDPVAKITIQEHNLELWPGYLTSIRQHEQDVLLCAEITHKVMRTDTVHDILRKITQLSRGANWQDEFMKTVIGMTVLTDYNNKFYRVDDVDFNTTPSSSFDTKAGPTTFVDYYRTKYNKNIKDRGQPMLISNAKARDLRAGMAESVALVPELCRATGITDEMRNNFQLMRAMGDYTRVGPDVRIRKLIEFNNRLYRSPESLAIFTQWQMTLDKNLVELTGRELANEHIVFSDGKKEPSDRNADWTAHFRGAYKFYNTTQLNNWIVFHLNQHSQVIHDFVNLMIDASRAMGFRINQPKYEVLRDDRSQTYLSTVDQCLASDDVQLIMFLSPNNRADRYSAIKKKCCVERAIPSQVMLAKTVTPKRGAPPRSVMSIATKVAIQINCKLGYSPWSVVMPLSGVMTLGFDVCHDSTNKSKSYGALVASMDLKSTNAKYFSTVSAHKNGEELSNEVGTNVLKALQLFRSKEGKLPAKIIFYRDGVGEGQLQYVLDHEVANIKSKLDQAYRSAESTYTFAFIVVNKRVNARFFKDSRMNPAPGTIVDDVVTAPESYDFYLVSQCVRQGTVTPTYYNVVTENLGLPADKLQIYTYKMCHLYFNWSGTTRVPAVCQYAHKLAFLVGQHIHQAPHSRLEKQLYFL